MLGRDKLYVQKKMHERLPWDEKAKAGSRGSRKNDRTPKRGEISYAPNKDYASSADNASTGERFDDVTDGVADSLDSLVSEEYPQDSSGRGRIRKAFGKIPGTATVSRVANYAIEKFPHIRIPGIPASAAVGLSGITAVVALTACDGVDPLEKLAMQQGSGHTERVVYNSNDNPTPIIHKSINPGLSEYSSLLAHAISEYPDRFDFVSDGLSYEEKQILKAADTVLFDNQKFLESEYGPDQWLPLVKTASIQAIPLLMMQIDVQEKPDGKHVINWPVGSLDGILYDLKVQPGMCFSCNEEDYDTVDEFRRNYAGTFGNVGHAHGEMLKTFAYFAKADSEGILVRSFMENEAEDLKMLYSHNASPIENPEQFFATVKFGHGRPSFMFQHEYPDGTVKSFQTEIYAIIGNAENQKEAAERLIEYMLPNENMAHFAGNTEGFADFFGDYLIAPGEAFVKGRANGASATGMMTSAFRLAGLKASQSRSPEYGIEIGSVEIDGKKRYYAADDFWARETENLPACAILTPLLENVEIRKYDPANCGE